MVFQSPIPLSELQLIMWYQNFSEAPCTVDELEASLALEPVVFMRYQSRICLVIWIPVASQWFRLVISLNKQMLLLF